MINLINEDCLPALKKYPDNTFDLAIVDPPFGIGKTWNKNRKGQKSFVNNYTNATRPPAEYFVQLKRVSRNWIIWGANFFDLWPSKNVIIWDKICTWEKDHKAECEIALTSLTHRPISIFRHAWSGGRKGPETGIKIIHPHQKPIALYKWCLEKYAHNGDSILDTHIGSASIALACLDLGFDLTAYEIDPSIFNAAKKRILEYQIKKSGIFDD
ncbi:MAG: DNA methyltransferase [Candidatus Paceibacterota bacterium]|jgi:site-specific DNA-methyltransferase (adenine-specific)